MHTPKLSHRQIFNNVLLGNHQRQKFENKQSVHYKNFRFIYLGSPPMSQTRSLLVRLDQKNEHDPVFERDSINQIISINEDSQPGEALIQFKATDLDQGLNGFVKYRFKYQSFPEIFDIDSLTGDVCESNYESP